MWKNLVPVLRVALFALVSAVAVTAQAASSKFCEGGGFSIVLPGGRVIEGDQRSSIPAAMLGAGFTVRGRHVQFAVVAATFGIQNYVFLASNDPGTQTVGNADAPVFARKTPDHRGLVLTGDVELEIDGDDIALQRAGTGVRMTLTAKDCTQGGVFQMEPEREDQTKTLFTHVLAPGVFYFDNPNFRAREGDVVVFDAGQDGVDVQKITVPSRINWNNDMSAKFVGRDSPQGGPAPNDTVRVEPPAGQCVNRILRRDGTLDTVLHCGQVSQWLVASGGRMGMVTGEDAVEVAPGAKDCVQDCQARNRVRGGAVVLGFPFPVPAASRLRPAFPQGFLP